MTHTLVPCNDECHSFLHTTSLRAVVRHDLPVFAKTTQQQGKMATEVAGGALQHPFAHHKVMIGRKRPEFQQVEAELAHGSSIGVAAFVIVEGGLPAPGGSAFAHKQQRVAFPVGLHKAFEVAPVPGGSLLRHQAAYGRFAGLGKTGAAANQQ